MRHSDHAAGPAASAPISSKHICRKDTRSWSSTISRLGSREVAAEPARARTRRRHVADRELVRCGFRRFAPTHVDPQRRRLQGPGRLARGRGDQRRWHDQCRRGGAARPAVKRFVYFQTALVLWAARSACRSRSIIRPGPSPATAFQRPPARAILRLSDLPWVSLRLANITGPRLAIGPIPTFYKRLKAGQKCFCTRYGARFSRHGDFLDVMDRADARGRADRHFQRLDRRQATRSRRFSMRSRSSRHRARPSRCRSCRPARTMFPPSCSTRPTRPRVLGWTAKLGFARNDRRECSAGTTRMACRPSIAI